MKKEFDPLRIMSRNGWVWDAYNEENEERHRYRMNVLGGSNHSTITAVTYEAPSHLSVGGDYGVTWLEAEYENKLPYSWNDLLDIQQAIITAEENLLTIGMPFLRDYKFHGRNIANKKRRNDKLRRMYDIDGMVTEDWQDWQETRD